jgi:hypothetical protein
MENPLFGRIARGSGKGGLRTVFKGVHITAVPAAPPVADQILSHAKDPTGEILAVGLQVGGKMPMEAQEGFLHQFLYFGPIHSEACQVAAEGLA